MPELNAGLNIPKRIDMRFKHFEKTFQILRMAANRSMGS